MAKRQIAYAAARFVADGQHYVAHRGDVVEIPDDEAKRLDGIGALVPVDGELERPGDLVALIDGASDEHVLNYLASGSVAEILQQSDGYPTSTVDRLLVAERAGQARKGLVAGLEKRLIADGAMTSGSTQTPGQPAAADALTEDEVAGILAKPVPEVLAAAAGNPTMAQRLAVAEQARTDREPRTSLVEGLAKIEAPQA